jgi:inhibitor of cysteine peptidase
MKCTRSLRYNINVANNLIASTQLEDAVKKIYLLLSVAMLSLGCLTLSPTAEPTFEPASDTFAITDPATPIEVQAGETFDIVLAANPSTGYHWEIVGELSGVEFVSSDYKADEPVMPGSGGVDVWTFKAVAAGQTEITLGSYAPGATEVDQTVTFNVVVK